MPREITNNNGFLERISSVGPCHRYLHIPHHRLVSPHSCESRILLGHQVLVDFPPLLGIGGIIASLYTENIMIASLLGVFAFSSFWTIKEIFEQEERVKKGWFPKNPKRIYKF